MAELCLHGDEGWVTGHSAANTFENLGRNDTSQLGVGVTSTEAVVRTDVRAAY